MAWHFRIVAGEDAALGCLDLAEGCGPPSKRVPSDRLGFDAGTNRTLPHHTIAIPKLFVKCGVFRSGAKQREKSKMADTPTHTTTVVEGRRGGGTTIVVAITILIAVVAGVWMFSQTSTSEARKDNAVENAANSVGNAADEAGVAAQDAARNSGN